jgi:hypothetical protein
MGVSSCLAALHDVAHESMYRSLLAALTSHQRGACSHYSRCALPKLSCCALQAGMWIGIAAGALLDGGVHGAAGTVADDGDADAGAEDEDMQPDADEDARRNATEVSVYPKSLCITQSAHETSCLLHIVIDRVSVCTTG